MDAPKCKQCGKKHWSTVPCGTTSIPAEQPEKKFVTIDLRSDAEKRFSILEDRIDGIEFVLKSIKEDARKYAKIRANQRERMARKRRKK
jgi:hypothetical protein